MGELSSRYADTLNVLSYMQGSMIYAARKQVLVRAEQIIVALEQETDKLRARIARADEIILQLTMHHHSDPDYVKGYEQAQEYFSDYPPKEQGHG